MRTIYVVPSTKERQAHAEQEPSLGRSAQVGRRKIGEFHGSGIAQLALGRQSRAQSRSVGEAGIGRLTMIVFGAFFSTLVWLGYNILPFYYYYFEITNQMQGLVAKAADLSDKEMRHKIMTNVRFFEIPAVEQDIVIERKDNSHIRIELPYEEIFYVSWQGKVYDLHVFSFRAVVEGVY